MDVWRHGSPTGPVWVMQVLLVHFCSTVHVLKLAKETASTLKLWLSAHHYANIKVVAATILFDVTEYKNYSIIKLTCFRMAKLLIICALLNKIFLFASY